jgi:hypothetical protein
LTGPTYAWSRRIQGRIHWLFPAKGFVVDIAPDVISFIAITIIVIVAAIEFEIGDGMEQPAEVAQPLVGQDVESPGQAADEFRDIVPDIFIDGRAPL